MPDAPYIHGTSPGEQERLGWMNRLLNDRELEALGLEGGERALELGAGTGLFATALARRLERGSVLAIERDPDQLAAARRAPLPANLELRQGDVLDPPLAAEEWGGFDLVHARFLLEHLTRPEEAVRVMARAVRPGGRVALVDDDHELLRLWPPAPRFEALWRAYCVQYEQRGMDPGIGRRLTGLLVGAGLEPVGATMLFFGACTGMEPFALAFSNLRGVVAGAAEAIVASGTFAGDAVRAGLEELERWQALPDAVLWYAIPLALGRRPASS